jgi:hypothetical protein
VQLDRGARSCERACTSVCARACVHKRVCTSVGSVCARACVHERVCTSVGGVCARQDSGLSSCMQAIHMGSYGDYEGCKSPWREAAETAHLWIFRQPISGVWKIHGGRGALIGCSDVGSEEGLRGPQLPKQYIWIFRQPLSGEAAHLHDRHRDVELLQLRERREGREVAHVVAARHAELGQVYAALRASVASVRAGEWVRGRSRCCGSQTRRAWSGLRSPVVTREPACTFQQMHFTNFITELPGRHANEAHVI